MTARSGEAGGEHSVFPAVWLSPRGVWALLALSVLVAASSVVSQLAGLVLVAAAAFVAAVLVDVRRAADARALLISRNSVGRLILGRSARITYVLENPGTLTLRIGLTETPVPTISFGSDLLKGALFPGERLRLEQNALPSRRGPVRFGALYLWVESGVGFLRRRYRVPADEETEVFPDLSAVDHVGTLAARRTLLEMGLRKLRLRGTGNEFESLREYTSGDSFRSVDWKATARRGRMIVQQYETERSAQVIVMLDCGRLMTPRMGPRQKFDYALAGALATVRIAQAADDHVGLSAFAGKSLLSIAPRRGRKHASAIMKAAFHLQPRLEESDYETAFLEVEHRYSKRGLVVLFTDIFDPVTSADTLSGLRRLARRHVVLCALMNDAAIATALNDKPTTAAQAYRYSVASALLDERASVAAHLRSLGIVVIDVPASQLTPALLDAYLDLKARARI